MKLFTALTGLLGGLTASSNAQTSSTAPFNPLSTLVSYMDAGACGPRGDDAQADLGQCSNGHHVVTRAELFDWQVVATIDGCDYVAYTVYACNTASPTSPPTTNAPTKAPTKAPTSSPTTNAPTKAPTKAPTMAPTRAPTKAPTRAPTRAPTNAPTKAPTEAPTKASTNAPTKAPTKAPTLKPTNAPTEPLTCVPDLVEFTGNCTKPLTEIECIAAANRLGHPFDPKTINEDRMDKPFDHIPGGCYAKTKNGSNGRVINKFRYNKHTTAGTNCGQHTTNKDGKSFTKLCVCGCA